MTGGVIIAAATVLAFGLIWAALVAVLRRSGKDFAYLTFFTIFYVYLFKVLDYTVFQFQSLIVLKLFNPRIMLNGMEGAEALNLVPLLTLTASDLTTSLLNILLMVPFGFGLPFITSLRARGVVLAGALFSIGIELLQFVTGLLAGVTFRVADVNDVVFNTVGTAVGYLAFLGFMHLYRQLPSRWALSSHPLLRHIAERPQLDVPPGTGSRARRQVS